MYELASGTALGATVLGTQIAASRSAIPAVAGAARATLPLTGVGFGVYVAVALSLIILGFILKRTGAVEAE